MRETKASHLVVLHRGFIVLARGWPLLLRVKSKIEPMIGWNIHLLQPVG